MNHKKIAVMLSLITLACLSGCIQQTKQQKTAKQIKSLTTDTADYTSTQDGLTVMVKAYTTEQEVTDLFGRRGKRLLKRKKAIYPVQVTVKNNTNTSFILNKKNINLSLVTQSTIIKRFYRNITGINAIFLSIGSTIATGIILNHSGLMLSASYSLASLLSPLLNPITFTFSAYIAGLTIMPIAIGTYTYYKIEQNAKAARKTIPNITLINSITCRPNQTINSLLFADAESFTPRFNITIKNTNEDEENYTFSINTEMENNH
jgi:hypothetical protein